MTKQEVELMKRDTTDTLFNATLQLVKDNGHYDKAAAIMDYVLPNGHEDYTRKAIALTNYEFDFVATANFGGSEGIYIDCYIDGEYTEEPIMKVNYNENITQGLIKETARSIGTFKTLRRDLEAMQIMGELCGSLTYYASEYINKNIERYTPTKELIKEIEV